MRDLQPSKRSNGEYSQVDGWLNPSPYLERSGPTVGPVDEKGTSRALAASANASACRLVGYTLSNWVCGRRHPCGELGPLPYEP